MFTGAIASSYYGLPRTTMDIDIIVTASNTYRKRLTEALREIGLVVSEMDFERALKSGYNIVSMDDSLSPFTVDLILWEGSLDRIPCTLFGEPTFLQTSENLVRAKLRMIKATIDPDKYAKDKEDVRAILRYSSLDMGRVRGYALMDGTVEILDSLLM
jgi:hypothetical protein